MKEQSLPVREFRKLSIEDLKSLSSEIFADTICHCGQNLYRIPGGYCNERGLEEVYKAMDKALHNGDFIQNDKETAATR